MTYQATRTIDLNFSKANSQNSRRNISPEMRRGPVRAKRSETYSASENTRRVRNATASDARPSNRSADYVRNHTDNNVRAKNIQRPGRYERELMDYRRAQAARKAVREREQAARAAAEKAKAEKAQAKRRAKLENKRKEQAFSKREIKVAVQKFPFSILALIIVIFMLMMGVIYSYSQISQTSVEISALKDDIKEKEAEAKELEILVAEKNDLNIIEKYATEVLMMVKESAVEKEYFSISGGDRVEIIEDNITSSPEASGGILSAFASAFGELLDYFK